MTVEGPTSSKTAGTVPSATVASEDVEKSLTSPAEAERGSTDVENKATGACVPVLLDTQKSFDNTKTEENPDDSNALR